jgi:CheY-like chemotaxis protein
MNGVILMVEDEPQDAILVQRQLAHSGLKHDLRIVESGQEAIDYLSGTGQYSDRQAFPEPCLLILDLKLPGIDGFDLVEWVRKNPDTRELPIIIYSGSISAEDAQRAYALGANAYFAKLAGPGHYNLLFTAIEEFCARGSESRESGQGH